MAAEVVKGAAVASIDSRRSHCWKSKLHLQSAMPKIFRSSGLSHSYSARPYRLEHRCPLTLEEFSNGHSSYIHG
jgi:hypothetical protein